MRSAEVRWLVYGMNPKNHSDAPKSGWEGGNAQILAAFNMLSSGVGLKETMSRCLSLSAFVFDKFEKTAPKTPRRIEVIVNSTVRITIEDVSDFKEVG